MHTVCQLSSVDECVSSWTRMYAYEISDPRSPLDIETEHVYSILHLHTLEGSFRS